MAGAQKTVVMNVSREKFWKAVLDYTTYPQFVDGVHKVNVIAKEGGATKVEYALELLGKDVKYVLNHDESGLPNRMTWTCVESNILKQNSGSWEVKELGPEKIEVDYKVELEFKIPVPSFMLGGLIKSSLPKMFDSFEKKARTM